ncbi:MAG: hypothetical protein ACREPZ_02565, partial [Rhodanobacteraceae bacterium]
MRAGSLRWGLLLLCLPVAAWAGDARVRVIPLPAAPVIVPGHAPAAVDGQGATRSRVWLHAPRASTAWYELRLADDWHRTSPPILAIAGNTRARVTVWLPPDYARHTETIFDAALDPTLSHHAVVYPLPADLRGNQPVYLALGSPGQTQPIHVRITDERSYRVGDLQHVRVSTFFASVQVSMVLVILCFWIVLRDRMFLYFVAYVGAQVVYGMAVSGELFALPGAGLLTAHGYHTGQSAATLAA